MSGSTTIDTPTDNCVAFADRNTGREFNRAQGTGQEEGVAGRESGPGARGRGRGARGPRRGGDRHSRAGQPKYAYLAHTIYID
jgi:hypothetical protein